MPFPMKKPMGAPMGGMPEGTEPEGDDSYIDDIMGQDMEGEDEALFEESPLESVLLDAGYKTSPEQIKMIEAILAKPPTPPASPDTEAPAMPGAPSPMKKPPSKMGGAVPAGIKGADLNL